MSFHRIIDIRDLADSAYVLRFERNGISFIPGQHIYVGLSGDDNRPYSIYSGLYDDYLEVLVKKVSNGNISGKLRSVKPGENVIIDQLQGSFIVEDGMKEDFPLWFICTGTGISPFHSFVRSYTDLNYRIIHGISYANEAYDSDVYGNEKYFCCATRDTGGDFNGRVTDYLKREKLAESAYYFLCGSYEMIDEVYDLLTERGIDKNQIKTEGYF